MVRQFEFPEGSTPIADCSGLIPVWVHNLNDLNRVEAENISIAQRKYLQTPIRDPKIWFHVEELKNIHRAMFGKVWNWAGLYRKSVTPIGIKPALIPSQLAEFCLDVVSWLQHPVELTFVEMAARIHHRLVLIHPFENGNGRFSRLIADRFLLAWRCPHPLWPVHLNQEGKARHEYIQTLKSADKGDYDPLVIFMKKLGACDPELDELIKNDFYRTHIKGKQGVSIVKALLRGGVQLKNMSDLSTLRLAEKAGLEEIARLLTDLLSKKEQPM